MEKEKLQGIIDSIKNKDFTLYFFTMDTKGVAKYSIKHTYDIVQTLTELGYDARILHEKEDYHVNSPIGWLGDCYNNIKHTSIEKDKLTIKPIDFVIVPEVFANVMEQLRMNNVPSKNIVMCQSPEYIFELLKPGKSWGSYDFYDVITTNKQVSDYVKDLFPTVEAYEIPVGISEHFKNEHKLKKPIISIMCRNQNDILKISKMFILKNPIYGWLNFRDIRGMAQEEMAHILDNSFLSVWIDDISGFGTFPIESMKCNTPVIGKIPKMIPEWMIEETEKGKELKQNGVWVNNVDEIPDLIAEFTKLWLQDELPEKLFTEMQDTAKLYTTDVLKEKTKEVFETIINNRITEIEKLMQ